VAARVTAPINIIVKQGDERLQVPLVVRLCCLLKPLDIR
jgi:hypothetical protein